MQNYFVYILKCSDGSFYTGHTDDLEKRLQEHRDKHYSCYTSERLPVELVYCEAFDSRNNALMAERKIKGWCRSKKEAFINNDFKRLHLLSKRSQKKESSFVSARGAPASGRTQQ